MDILSKIPGNMLCSPSNKEINAEDPELDRSITSYQPLHTYRLEKDRSYQQQYGDMYFLRLTEIKPFVERIAEAAWCDTVVGGERAKRVDRVLDVRQGELVWVAGTIFMDMPLKPNILDDVSKDRWISAPVATQKYYDTVDHGQCMLEDESGRIPLTGELMAKSHLVTGVIVAALGTENVNGELEVYDIKVPDLPPQPPRWALSPASKKKVAGGEDVEMADAEDHLTQDAPKIAFVSGLNFTGESSAHNLEISLLTEFLLGESMDPATQREAARISRLVIAGNSVNVTNKVDKEQKKKKYGYDASAYNPAPSRMFDTFLCDVLPSIPVTVMPGPNDPANTSFPQQPVHAAMFPGARSFVSVPGGGIDEDYETIPVPDKEAKKETLSKKGKGEKNISNKKEDELRGCGLDVVTNPWEAEMAGWRFLGTSGQNVDDIFKYLDTDDRIGMMEALLKWRCIAPTAPDTLWSYPFQDDDPFVIRRCPHVFFTGNQPRFGTALVESEGVGDGEGGGVEGTAVRIIAIPDFSRTGELVLLDTETLEVSCIQFRIGRKGEEEITRGEDHQGKDEMRD